MENYLQLMSDIITNGNNKSDRTGTGTRSLFGYQLRFDLQKGFPLVTTKKVHLKAIIHELLWFLKGETNIAYLKENNVRIWDEWADENGDLGPVYGAQWRSWRGNDGQVFDQISQVLHELQTNPDSRRHIVSAWNVGELDQMALAPCHTMFQFYVAPATNPNQRPKLSLQLYQRSADVFLGVPFNIASYALLQMMIAQVCNFDLGHYVHSFGDVHIYNNHFPQVELQLSRKVFELPKITLNPDVTSLFDFEYQDFTLEGYQFHPAIKATVSV